MVIKALFLDFYGTIVHEDDDIISAICDEIKGSAKRDCTIEGIGHYWGNAFAARFRSSCGESFRTQRELALQSLEQTIDFFESSCIAEECIRKQFDYWKKPGIYADSKPFLDRLPIPAYILSNIDTHDVLDAIKAHRLRADGVLTSEDVRSYKPRPELFRQALEQYGLGSHEVVHVGDSLTSDIMGAQRVGIRAIWINRRRRKPPESIKPDRVIADLFELHNIL